MPIRPVIVVGAGLAGLTATLQLARRGVPVTLLDGSGRLGGRARSTGPDGFTLNLGPHGMLMGGPGAAVLKQLGIALPGGPPAYRRARLLVDGRIVGPLDRRHGGGGLRTLAGVGRLARDARRGDPDGSVADWLARRLPDARARGTATVLARLLTYADSPDTQAADVMAEALRAGAVRYLDGGWGALVGRLDTATRAAGAEVRTGSGVAAVRRDADHWRVELRTGDVLEAAAVILAAGGPADVAGLLDGPAHDVAAGWARRATPVHMACLDVALARRPAGPAGVFGVDEPLYLSVQSDASDLAPAGGAVVQVARFLPVGGTAPDGTRGRLEALLDQALPGWRAHVVQARYLPDLTVTHDGCLVSAGGRRARPGPEVPGAPGLYVAGDWVGTRGTLSQASIASASTAASAVATSLAGRAGRTDPHREQVA